MQVTVRSQNESAVGSTILSARRPTAEAPSINCFLARYQSLRAEADEALDELMPWFDWLAASVGDARAECRIKSSASTWRKMESQGLCLQDVHDLLGVRVIVRSETDCRRVARQARRRWNGETQVKDYISKPKANGYRSLHAILRTDRGVRAELQVRTWEMHEACARGPAAHWIYKRTPKGVWDCGGWPALDCNGFAVPPAACLSFLSRQTDFASMASPLLRT